MQCNQSFCCTGYTKCGNAYAYNCTTGPQRFTNPLPTLPCSSPQRPCPEVIGEGEVTTVILPDGTTQLYFLPLTKWCKPQIFNQNQQPFDNNFLNNNCGIWLIRSVYNPTPPQFPYCNQNQMCFTQPQAPLCCNFPVYPALKFHNDGWTSTTDLKYFYPGIRCTVCTVLPSKCTSMQTSLDWNRGVASKSCEKKPSSRNAKCSYDSVLLYSRPNKMCSQTSCLCTEEHKPRKIKGKDNKKRAKKNTNLSSSGSSTILTCRSCVSLEKCSEEECCKKHWNETKKTKQSRKRSEPRCCVGARKRRKKHEVLSIDCGDSDDLCSICKHTDKILNKCKNLQCEPSVGESVSIGWDDCTVLKETNCVSSPCSSSTDNSALDHKTELWTPNKAGCSVDADMEWCSSADFTCVCCTYNRTR